MTVQNRAKQFAPFAAITGLDRALEKKRRELERCEKRTLSEERAAELDERLRALRKGMTVGVCYYDGQTYRRASGRVERLEETEDLLVLDRVRIPLSAIAELSACFPEENAI